jgi:heat shock protein HtpX
MRGEFMLNQQTLKENENLNKLNTLLFLLFMIALMSISGFLVAGRFGLLMGILFSLGAIGFPNRVPLQFIMKMQKALPLKNHQAPELYNLTGSIARTAHIHGSFSLYYLPTPIMNAFTIGNQKHFAIAISQGLLDHLSPRELQAVIAHEIAHVKNNDLQLMQLSGIFSGITQFFSILGQVFLIFLLPAMILGIQLPFFGLLFLLFSPALCGLLRLALSRTREFEADRLAAELCGTPQHLASSLKKMEKQSQIYLRRFPFLSMHNTPEWLRTHPDSNERIQRLLSYRIRHQENLWDFIMKKILN